jgi:hypothetical protein
VTAAESTVTTLAAALEDPGLYTTADGVARSAELGVTLERARRTLDAALEAWTAATEALERLSPARSS